MELTPEIVERIQKLRDKYDAMGQELTAYLDGLLYANYVSYWDYIHLDTLLSLQTPRTDFPDEQIFIMYHQVTELYFKLSLHEYDQICNHTNIDKQFFIQRVMRINRYFEALTKSFEIMYKGMERDQFLKFRMSLIPASGFQSAQYRMIEICSTDFIHLVQKDERHRFQPNPEQHTISEMFEFLYWKRGATEEETGKKTLTLRQFERKYTGELTRLAEEFRSKNIWKIYKKLSAEDQQDTKVINVLKQLDVNVNINWPLMHYKSAVTYLQNRPNDKMATGGTNWKEYLPPKFQKRIFYPEIWSEQEIEEWGKSWVESLVGEL
tara:strand:+ start:39685 stop:40650 length:966 start_codon:yes stop_codon:yes gene_type:complete